MCAYFHAKAVAAVSIVALASAITSAASADDCIRLKDRVDKILCVSADAKAADDGMVRAYDRLKNGLDKATTASLLRNQRNWLVDRSRTCPENGETEAACVIRWSNSRRDWLDGTPAQGPGRPGALAPYVIGEDGAKGHWSKDITLFRFKAPAAPGEIAFNAAVDKAVADVPDRMDGAGEGDHGTWSLQGKLVWASPSFISLRVDASEFAQGAAHGLSWTQNINVDLSTGRPVVIRDIFPEAKLHDLTTACLSQIRTQLADAYKEGGNDPDKDPQTREALHSDMTGMRKDVAKITADASHWTFDRDGAVVTYDQDAVASHAAGAFECRLPMAQLQAAAKVPLPLH
ncbi:lysozyme inhibitor LprI family protein [Methylobacterium oryzae CBMB20]